MSEQEQDQKQNPKLKVIFIAGPFRAATSWGMEQNIRRAEELSLKVWQSGAVALCPHTNTRFFQGEADDAIWLAGTLELLRRCDAVLMVPGWQESEGARIEHAEAEIRMLPIIYVHERNPDNWIKWILKIINDEV